MSSVVGPLTTYVIRGLAADRPASPSPLATGSVAVFYHATDTDAVSFWNGSSWISVGGGGSPGGSSGQLQYNNSGAFGGVTLSTDLVMSGATLKSTARPKLTQVQLQANSSKSSTSSATMQSWGSSDVILDEVSAWASGSPTRFTCPSGFTQCRITAYTCWAANSTNFRYCQINLSGTETRLFRDAAHNETTTSHETHWYRGLTPGTSYFEIGFAQDSGGALNLTGSSTANGDCTFVQFEWLP